MEVVSVTLPEALLQEIDVRAKSLDMSRSQYFRHLARHDLESDSKPRKTKAA